MSRRTEFVRALLEMDGVESVNVQTTFDVTHRKHNTGEVDENYQEIRERAVTEDEFQSLAIDYGVKYQGTVKVIGDFRLRDRFTDIHTVKDEDSTFEGETTRKGL